MGDDIPSGVRTLDPVVVAALETMTQVVYRRRGPRLKDKFRQYHGMQDRHSRDAAISTFSHLKQNGYDFPPFLLRRWALANGWKEPDAQLLDDYAAGVLAGVKYHHADSAGRTGMDAWRRASEARGPWVDPGRPARGVLFTRRD